MHTDRARAVVARASSLPAAELHRLSSVAGGDIAAILRPGFVASHASVQVPPYARAALASPDAAAVDCDLDWLQRSGARILLCTDPDYPPLLAQVGDAPAALYVLGDPAVLSTPQLAVVGSRNPTVTGRETARSFCAWFARAGLTVTSGLALGIDAAAHEGALRGAGATVAVCATGLDLVYPREHAALAARIRDAGALVSEFPPGTPARRRHFPQRNRLIAGLSLGTLVVEAARRSGSLITARLANEQGREVFAIPGSIHSPLARGCHQLIRNGAQLVEQASDVLDQLRFTPAPQPLGLALGGAVAATELDKEYEMLLDALDFAPVTVDALAARTHLPAESVASMLLILELQGRVATCPGGRYALLPRSDDTHSSS